MKPSRSYVRTTDVMRSLVEAIIVGLYILAFAVALLTLGYTVDFTAPVVIAHALLTILGWRNPPIVSGKGGCIMYRTGFLPLYASAFILAAGVYSGAFLNEAATVTMLILAIIGYLVAKTLVSIGKTMLNPLIQPLVVGIVSVLLLSRQYVIALSFSLSQLTLILSNTDILCESGLDLYIAGVYSSSIAGFLLLLGVSPQWLS